MTLVFWLVLIGYAVLICCGLIRGRRDRELAVVREQQARLHLQREQYAAERRVQALAQHAFDQLLEGARAANGGVMPETAPPRETFDLDLRRAM